MDLEKTHLPIYYSRFTPNLPPGYGAFIKWEVGETVLVKTDPNDVAPLASMVMTETMVHPEAPIIEGAYGRGRWAREVEAIGTSDRWATSEANLLLPNQETKELNRETID